MAHNKINYMKKLFIGLGSNLGDRGKNLQDALVLLEKWGIKVVRSSSIYETEPIGYKNQPDFYNMVVEAETASTPEETLNILHTVERALGRIRDKNILPSGPRPRTIDLDLLFFNDQIINKEGLSVPHPRIHERRFVLIPMVEIAPDFFHPLLKKKMRKLLQECKDNTNVRDGLKPLPA